MHAKNIIKAFIFTTFTSLLSYNFAFAEGNCPPGYYPIGGGTSGWHGCAPMDGGIKNDNYNNNNSYYDDGEAYRNQKLLERQKFLIYWEKEGKFVAKRQEEERKKEIEKLNFGVWEIFKGKKNAKKGEYCTAMYTQKEGIVSIHGPGGDYKGALLSFSAKDIPLTKKPKIIELTLEQSGDKPQKVKAYNYSFEGMEYGIVSFAVPTIKDATDNMSDKLAFKVTSGKKTLINIEWNQGLDAKKKLIECLNGNMK